MNCEKNETKKKNRERNLRKPRMFFFYTLIRNIVTRHLTAHPLQRDQPVLSLSLSLSLFLSLSLSPPRKFPRDPRIHNLPLFPSLSSYLSIYLSIYLSVCLSITRHLTRSLTHESVTRSTTSSRITFIHSVHSLTRSLTRSLVHSYWVFYTIHDDCYQLRDIVNLPSRTACSPFVGKFQLEDASV